ncbi:helix-turn-helix domain-containing protein [Sanguibacter keddieii]
MSSRTDRSGRAGTRQPDRRRDVTTRPQPAPDTRGGRQMVVLRREIGDVLRDARQLQGRTLREVSSAARVSLGYLSEVERGQKEASSELLGSICEALDIPLSSILREVSDRIAVAEGLLIPDTVPADLAAMGRDALGRTAKDLQPIG